MKILAAVFALATLARPASGQWEAQQSGTEARLRGVSVASPTVAWASGNRGTCLRTDDAGRTWRAVAPPDSAGLDFRDVEALGPRSAALLSIGPGELSRIYRTDDAGATWTLTFQNRDPKGFLDALAFWDDRRGLALGDPVGGKFTILATEDGGRTWQKLPEEGMPDALPGEGAFAASGTCLVVGGDSNAWFGTGSAARARVFRSTDRGRTWAVAETPIRAGTASAGIFSLAFREGGIGVAAGGDYKEPDNREGVLATTDDGGRTWKLVGDAGPSGFRSAVALIPGPRPAVVAVGPTGWSLSPNGGRTWLGVAGPGFHAVAFPRPEGPGWAVGEGGRISRFDPKDGG